MVVWYMEDIIMHGKDGSYHNTNLYLALGKLKSKRIQLNPSRCVFEMSSIQHLGHEASEEGIRPAALKVGPTLSLTDPKDKQGVQIVFEMSNFLENFSITACPMYGPMKKDGEFIMRNECKRAYERLKELLAEATDLYTLIGVCLSIHEPMHHVSGGGRPSTIRLRRVLSSHWDPSLKPLRRRDRIILSPS